MNDGTNRRLMAFLRAFLGGVGLLAALLALRYVFMGPDGVLVLRAADVAFHRIGRQCHFFANFVAIEGPKYHAHAPALLLHITGMSIALSVGSFQLLLKTRGAGGAAHRVLGWIYSTSALVGAGSGSYLALALPMIGSPLAVAANVFAGLLEAAFILFAIRAALLRDIVSHQRFAIRSYGVLATLLTLYAIVAVLIAAGVPAPMAYELGHDFCLPMNLLAVEALLLHGRRGFAVRGTAMRILRS